LRGDRILQENQKIIDQAVLSRQDLTAHSESKGVTFYEEKVKDNDVNDCHKAYDLDISLHRGDKLVGGEHDCSDTSVSHAASEESGTMGFVYLGQSRS
jgi:hypothetical protein